ncbi:hypothetical protein Anapl_02141 [Anas platyrhynchos]|uniref:Uncharacterized protein n=1 Tax=Anas platyrhynchos TaxID=8839 RepID=R0K4Y5_ANAPL|nr:hypothetical protein Anapl_02141 [Anas platyrhynchos]
MQLNCQFSEATFLATIEEKLRLKLKIISTREISEMEICLNGIRSATVASSMAENQKTTQMVPSDCLLRIVLVLKNPSGTDDHSHRRVRSRHTCYTCRCPVESPAFARPKMFLLQCLCLTFNSITLLIGPVLTHRVVKEKEILTEEN